MTDTADEDECRELHVRTLTGLEELLAAELTALGATEVACQRRLVTCRGDRRLLYAANLHCRLAIRILVPIRTFPAADEDALYAGVAAIDWGEHMRVEQSFAIDAIVNDSQVTHSLYAAQKTKDAIVDQFRQAVGKRPSVNVKRPDVQLHLYLWRDQATVYLDSSGQSLHKRGYRPVAGAAPLNEVLAAGMLRLAGYDGGGPLVDPMCGSGTIAIEAATIAAGIAPGLRRRSFGFMHWPDYDAELFQEIKRQARGNIREPQHPIVGGDVDGELVTLAETCAQNAGVADIVRFHRVAMEQADPPPADGGPAWCVFNPPYDERLPVWQTESFYRQFGDVLKRRFPHYDAWVLTGNALAAKRIGLRAARKVVLFNGPIECRLLHFPISDAPQSATPPASPQRLTEGWAEQTEMFANRLRKQVRHLGKWARKQGIDCWRAYDRDIPDVPLSLDLYADHLHAAEYDRPHDRTPEQQRLWLDHMLDTAAAVLGIDRRRVHLKHRRRQRGSGQYTRIAEGGNFFTVPEGEVRFLVNLDDYLDTGLFLDHRNTRAMVREAAAGKDVLNLFAYTGSFTVHAAAGGAASTVTVDSSTTYCQWAEENLRINGIGPRTNAIVRSGAIEFLDADDRQFDLVVADPPTFSNTKSGRRDWDVQRDHRELLGAIARRLRPGGRIYFSTNFRQFKLGDPVGGLSAHEITRQTIPEDFRNKRIHRCWVMEK